MRLRLQPGEDVAALVGSAIAESRADSFVVVAAPSSDALWRALARAAIGPLAIASAPSRRVNAVFVAEGAAEADVAAAVAFLDRARSTTGQILDVGATASSQTSPTS